MTLAFDVSAICLGSFLSQTRSKLPLSAFNGNRNDNQKFLNQLTSQTIVVITAKDSYQIKLKVNI